MRTHLCTPKVALCQQAFPDTAVGELLEIAADVGADGISVAASRLSADTAAADVRRAEARGIPIALGIPEPWTILPPRGGVVPVGTTDHDVRLAQIAASIRSLAAFRPESIMLCTGPAGDRSEAEARRMVVEGLAVLGAVAAEEGTRLSVEPMRESFRPVRTLVCSLGETLDLLEEVGRDDVGITYDTWHLWDSPGVHELLPEAAPLFHIVQIADYRERTRGPMDRVVAGAGIAGIPRFLRDLRAAGYDGWYDLEVFSDDGRFGSQYEDSLWALDPRDFAHRQVQGLRACWAASCPNDDRLEDV